MVSQRDIQQLEVRLKVMRLIAANPELSTRDVAREVGISNGSAYYVLTALVEKGFVKLGNFKQSPRKGQYAYLLTPSGFREKSLLTHSFIESKRQEFQDLRAEIQALEEDVGLVEATAATQSEEKQT
jgi:EPS-associated MarR family transcriptional regulator